MTNKEKDPGAELETPGSFNEVNSTTSNDIMLAHS